MRPLQRVEPEPECLAEYKRQNPDATWTQFRREADDCKKEVVKKLFKMQNGLCAYCEIDTTLTDRQVEHYHPKSKSDLHAHDNRHLEWENLLLCCVGGTVAETAKRVEEHRVADAVGDVSSCGQNKDDTVCTTDLNSYTWDTSLVRMELKYIGENNDPSSQAVSEILVCVDEKVCQQKGVSSQDVENFVALLNLNGPRLCIARSATYQKVIDRANTTPNDKIDSLLRELLLPNTDNVLHRFISTVSMVFGPRGERFLATHQQN